MKEFSFADLGQLVILFEKAGHYTVAQNYLDEMQARITKAKAEPNEILDDLPMVETSKPTLEYKQPVVNITMTPEHEGPPRDDQGNITRISTQLGDPGYDPDVHENQELKIFCNDVHIPTAHTADTVEGLVWYYKKNEKGRIKALEKRGKVEIRGL
ncbi:hypothetical protein KAR91_20335 [Candidatus Pacearchaeota archaeon]|nr:hypothetical protein [Candidatus Pacearchaeota archaeon]